MPTLRISLRVVATVTVALVLASGCTSDGEEATPPPAAPTTTGVTSTTEAGPALPVELQRLIDATSLQDLDDAYAEVPLPQADSHVAVIVEDAAAVEAPPSQSATVSDYVNTLLRVEGPVSHFVTEIESEGGLLECHIVGGSFGVCGLPAPAEDWTEPSRTIVTNTDDLVEVIYTVRNDAVLIDTVFADGTVQRSEQPGGIVLVRSTGQIPTTLTLYFADGLTQTFELRSLPEPEPETLEDE